MGLFSGGWRTGNREQALAWVARQKPDSPGLLSVVSQSEDPEVRKAALEKISDPKVLQGIVLLDRAETSVLAAKRVQDPEVLAEAAKDYCLSAACAITDPETLLEIALNREGGFFHAPEESARVREKIKDPAFDATLAACRISGAAVAGMSDDGMLERVQDEAEDPIVQVCAMRRRIHLRPELAAEIVADGSVPLDRRVTALREGRFSADELRELADTAQEEKIRTAAIDRITDPELRKAYCLRDNYHHFRAEIRREYPKGKQDGHYIEVTVLRCPFCGKETETRRNCP